ncbi:MAG TPA: VCBS repeat-containing protein [Candidatus Sulfotelmatobacter sp.]
MSQRNLPLFFLAFLFLIAFKPAFAAANAPFVVGTTYPTGKAPDAIAVGDFNQDGRPDIVVADQVSARVSVSLTKTNGTETPAVAYPVKGGARTVAVADLNGDGKLDIVSSGGGTMDGYVNVLLGNGDGTFQPAVTYPILVPGYVLTVADFNGDGHPDVAVGGYSQFHHQLFILLNQGDGTFQVSYSSTIFSGITQVVAGDFNHDKKQDLLISYAQGDTYLALGNGDGTFQNPLVVGGGIGIFSAVADFNGDGKLDFATVAPASGLSSGNISIYLGNGDGTFQKFATNPTTGLSTVAVITADLNGDGKIDLVALDTGSSDFSVMLGNGDGTFKTPVTYAAGTNPKAVAVADFNGDHKQDLAVISAFNQLSVFAGSGDGTLQDAHTFLVQSIADFNDTNEPAIGDLNGDGLADVVVPNFPGGAGVLLNSGGGSFQQPVYYAPATAHVALGDFNGDGKLDMASVGQGVSVLLGKGDGTFQPAVTYQVPQNNNVLGVTVGDFNRDGKLDLAAVSYQNVYIFFGNGDGTLKTPIVYTTLQPNMSFIDSADLNNDGILDLYVTGFNGAPVQGEVLLGQSGGHFAQPIYSGDSGGFAAVLADFNGDGVLDIADVAGELEVSFGKGDGTFTSPTIYPVYPRCVAVADLNHDGHPDLVVTGAEGLSILYGAANGIFGSAVNIPNTFNFGLALGDVNGDGWPDLVALGGLYSVEVALNSHGTIH